MVTKNCRSLCAMLALVAVLWAMSFAMAGCSSSAAAATQDTTAATTQDTTTSAGLFDSSLIHEITVSFAQEDYETMIQTYQESGEKEWINATVTIDGKTYENVGMRLKGNSSIMGLGRNSRERMGGGNGIGDGVSADSPEELPWLIDLDKNVDNQNHGGIVELVVRSSTTETALNEAVALRLIEEAGLASQEAVAVRFSINGSDALLRLVVQNPDDVWMADNFDTSGVLYKAESTGDYSYRGEDAGSYDEVFDQEAGKTNADLTPLIDFLDFINNSDDTTFNAELPEWLDIDSFATYLAIEELIANSDDIEGPGNNSYLYYDTGTERFTVVAWDHNLAFGTMNRAGGLGDKAEATPPGAGRQDSRGTPSGNVTNPEDAQSPSDIQRQSDVKGIFGGRSNILVERFSANPEWQQLYEERLAELQQDLYESGVAASILDEWVTLLKTQAADLVDATTVDAEAAQIATYFVTR